MLEDFLPMHDSHNPYYRFPFGACTTDADIFLAIDIVAKQSPSSVSLRLWHENLGEKIISLQNSPQNPQHYAGRITTPTEGCLLWYYFIIKTEKGTIFYGNNVDHTGGIGQMYDQSPASFQITVYQADATTPPWFRHGVMYQIFPDRFYRHGSTIIPKKNAVYHADWHDTPYYYKDVDTKEIVSYDFFGGNIAGIKEKLPYLQDLGISVIYLNPVFESASNHHYDTGNYHKIDPILGSNEDFIDLCHYAKKLGIRIILDGVFSHTGSDSLYFNRYNNYPSIGAYQSKASPYYDWYTFRKYPCEYDSWWGFNTLPNVNETDPSYMNFIIDGENSVLRHWMKNGISGWRLDVIDELPQKFSRHFYKVLKSIQPDSVLIGEVWEDASNKVSYGVSREYLCGGEMDSAMNYPFRKTVLDFLLKHITGKMAIANLTSQKENYPIYNYYAMMNLVSSHDVERVITLLGEAANYENMPATAQAHYKLDPAHYKLGLLRSRLAALWQMTFPGVPSIYYGDEIGMQGLRDPYNRGAYAWDTDNTDLREWFKKLIKLRNQHIALQTGELLFLEEQNDVIAYLRCIRNHQDAFGKIAENDAFVIIINRSSTEKAHIKLDLHGFCHSALTDVLNKTADIPLQNDVLELDIEKLSGIILRQSKPSFYHKRNCGILLHPTCLYTPYGIGDLGQTAFSFIDWLHQGNQKYWQILPLNPVGFGASPYQSSSVFAGNKLLISPDSLLQDGLLISKELYQVVKNSTTVEFSTVATNKDKLLRKAFSRFSADEPFYLFCRNEKYWLDDYALYSALKKFYCNLPWTKWPKALKQHSPDALKEAAVIHQDEINYVKFVQYIFFKQWDKLKKYANSHDIKIIGDMPIFPSHDSADVWANQTLFNLDKDGSPITIAGVPPDYFSKDGQLWGNPHYRWDAMAKDNYKWWTERFRTLTKITDVIRLDHFRGFASYWAVDAKALTAREGKWQKGPGLVFFQTIKKQLPHLSLIAEDLGVITSDVEKLKNDCNLPGMKVLQFELQPNKQKRIGFSCAENNIVYTGTHDNDTTIGWLTKTLSPEDKAILAAHLHTYTADAAKLCKELMEYAYNSDARTVILPLQDVLLLDSSARMNLPGTVGKNWRWYLLPGSLTEKSAAFLANLCTKYNR
ncbi:4-alpha-glucanotransferase [Pectinatus cerevisiiphilus]|uniref:4-alpha-glucanotransferase n=1 Tax=Pectinatus cerevisiiphilus TaxID=86956 RepID=UPI001E63ABD9|nr:4-alpha-glucanotransferase [Pectinatus cerevisiiphilus]